MKRRISYNYSMDFNGRSHFATAALMGAAFFLRAVYYFGFTRPETVGAWNLIIFLILPLLLEAAFMVMIRGLRWNMPGIYGIMGAVYCLLLLLQSFSGGNVLRIILSVIAYLACAAALWGIGEGLLSKSLTVAVLSVTLAIRFLIFDLSGYIISLRVVAFIREAAALCGLLSLVCLCVGLTDKKRK